MPANEADFCAILSVLTVFKSLVGEKRVCNNEKANKVFCSYSSKPEKPTLKFVNKKGISEERKKDLCV